MGSKNQNRHAYMKYWSDEYESSADVNLVLGKSTLPVHRSVLAVSEVLCKKLRPATSTSSARSKTARAQTELKGVSKDNMILLLSHVYTTDHHLSAENISEARLLVDLANQFGFRAVAAKCLSLLTTDKKFLAAIREDLDGNDPDVVSRWLTVALTPAGEGLRGVVAEYLAAKYFTIFGRNPSAERKGAWAKVVDAVHQDTAMMRSVSHHLAQAYEDKPQQLDFGFDRNYAAVYGVGFGLFIGFIVPGWFLTVAILGSILMMGRRYSLGLQKVVDTVTRGVVQKVIQQCVHNLGSQPFIQEIPANGKGAYYSQHPSVGRMELLE